MGNSVRRIVVKGPSLTHHKETDASSTLLGAQGMKLCGGSTAAKSLIVANECTSEITLLDIHTKSQTQLPRISSMNQHIRNQCIFGSAETKSHTVHKAVLSSSSHDHHNNFSDYIVLVIYGESKELAYYRARSKTWTLLKEAGSCYDDVISHEGEFYAVDEYGRVVLCNLDSTPVVTELTKRWFFWGHKVYLVAVEQDLCMVIRYLDDKPYFGRETYHLKVHILNGKNKWYKLGDLGNWMILLGHLNSVALPVEDNLGLKANRVYFKDDMLGPHQIRVFSLEDDFIESLECSSDDLQLLWHRHLIV